MTTRTRHLGSAGFHARHGVRPGRRLPRPRSMAKDGTFQHLRVFEDVVSLVVNNYVEEVDVTRRHAGRPQGSGRRPRSRQRLPDARPGAAVGVEQRRRPGRRRRRCSSGSTTCASCRLATARPRRRAGLRTGDFIRGIDDKPTRDMSAFEGARLLQGAPGSKVKLLVFRGNAAEPHDVVLTRERVDRHRRHLAHGQRHHRLRARGRVLQGHAGTAAGGHRHAGQDRAPRATCVDLRGTATRRPRRRHRRRAAVREERARWRCKAGKAQQEVVATAATTARSARRWRCS